MNRIFYNKNEKCDLLHASMCMYLVLNAVKVKFYDNCIEMRISKLLMLRASQY